MKTDTDKQGHTHDKASEEQIGGSHYKDMPIQPAHFIRVNAIPFHEGCAIEYVCRHKSKNGADDIRKAIHFLELILEEDCADPV